MISGAECVGVRGKREEEEKVAREGRGRAVARVVGDDAR